MGLHELPDETSRLTVMSSAERRIVYLHYYLEEKKYFPWMWDYENYSGDNADMVGFFYPEDFANLQMIENMIAIYEKEQKALRDAEKLKKQ
jgi:hypothetical protein